MMSSSSLSAISGTGTGPQRLQKFFLFAGVLVVISFSVSQPIVTKLRLLIGDNISIFCTVSDS